MKLTAGEIGYCDHMEWSEQCAEYFLRAGMELAAKICEAKVEREADYGGRFGGYGKFMDWKRGDECAAAIRQAAKE